MVGAVLLRDGVRVGEGFHRRVGGPHAEVEALAAAGPEAARGATLFVPRAVRPPWAHAAVHGGDRGGQDRPGGGGHRDPDPRVWGAGLARLRAAGIEIEEGRLAAEAVRLNLRYLVPKPWGARW